MMVAGDASQGELYPPRSDYPALLEVRKDKMRMASRNVHPNNPSLRMRQIIRGYVDA